MTSIVKSVSLALVVAAATFAVGIVTPAAAKSRPRAVPQNQFNQLPSANRGANSVGDPTGVYRNGRLIGRDPDPAVRLQIEQFYGRGGAA